MIVALNPGVSKLFGTDGPVNDFSHMRTIVSQNGREDRKKTHTLHCVLADKHFPNQTCDTVEAWRFLFSKEAFGRRRSGGIYAILDMTRREIRSGSQTAEGEELGRS